jgi:hypothetical protein
VRLFEIHSMNDETQSNHPPLKVREQSCATENGTQNEKICPIEVEDM